MQLHVSRTDIAFAIRIVTEAARLARTIQMSMAMLNLTKSDRSPVTVADFAIQALVARALNQEFPSDRLVAEEASNELRDSPDILDTVCRFLERSIPSATTDNVCAWIDSGTATPDGRFWTLDPVDGTKGYLRGGQYAVALALVVDGRVEVAAIACPNLGDGCTPAACGEGCLVIAARGMGTWTRPMDACDGPLTQLRVSACTDAARARLLRSFETAHTSVENTDKLCALLSMKSEQVIMDSMAKYVVLSAGHAEIAVRFLSQNQPDYRETVWDVAPGSLIIEEAGGRITDLHGADLDFRAGPRLMNNRGILATNGRVHDAVLEAIAQLD